jgi:ankyrin repeat protein
MLAFKRYSLDYSQKVPRDITRPHLAVYFGLREAMIALIESGYYLDLKDSYGRTPLSWAAASGEEAVAKLLLGTGKVDAGSKDKDGRTALSWGAANGQEAVVKLRLDTSKVDADSKDITGRTPLSWAIVSGQETVVKLLQSRDSLST